MAEKQRDANGDAHRDRERDSDTGHDNEFNESERSPIEKVSDTLKPPNPLPPKPKG